MENRKVRRQRFTLPVQYANQIQKKYGGSLAHDISEGGLKLVVNEFIPPQTELVVRIEMTGKNEFLEVAGYIVWTKKIPYSDGYYVGLKFAKVSPLVQEVVHSYRQAS